MRFVFALLLLVLARCACASAVISNIDTASLPRSVIVTLTNCTGSTYTLKVFDGQSTTSAKASPASLVCTLVVSKLAKGGGAMTASVIEMVEQGPNVPILLNGHPTFPISVPDVALLLLPPLLTSWATSETLMLSPADSQTVWKVLRNVAIDIYTGQVNAQLAKDQTAANAGGQ